MRRRLASGAVVSREGAVGVAEIVVALVVAVAATPTSRAGAEPFLRVPALPAADGPGAVWIATPPAGLELAPDGGPRWGISAGTGEDGIRAMAASWAPGAGPVRVPLTVSRLGSDLYAESRIAAGALSPGRVSMGALLEVRSVAIAGLATRRGVGLGWALMGRTGESGVMVAMRPALVTGERRLFPAGWIGALALSMGAGSAAVRAESIGPGAPEIVIETRWATATASIGFELALATGRMGVVLGFRGGRLVGAVSSAYDPLLGWRTRAAALGGGS